MKLDKYIFSNDIFKHTNHMFYLYGGVANENVGHCIASFNTKTRELRIKNASEWLPSEKVLNEFMMYAIDKVNGIELHMREE